jgi:hypothetical protein
LFQSRPWAAFIAGFYGVVLGLLLWATQIFLAGVGSCCGTELANEIFR